MGFAIKMEEGKILTLTIEKIIAKGAEGIVCVTEYEGEKVALKIDYTKLGATAHSFLKEEYDMLTQLNHNNIIKAYKFIAANCDDVKVLLPKSLAEEFNAKLEGKIKLFSKDNHLVVAPHAMILMELCSKGLLFDLVKKKDGISDIAVLRAYFTQICDGVSAIHNAGIINYDLKLENMLIGSDGEVKICDF